MTKIEDRLSTDPRVQPTGLEALGLEAGGAEDRTEVETPREGTLASLGHERLWWLLVGVLLIVWGLRFDAYVTLRPWVAAPMVVEVALGLMTE